MGIMDLSINQEAMGVQNRLGNHVFKLKEYDETDVKGNNNLYNSRKTDTNDDPSSLFRDAYSSENLQVDPSLFSYSSFKKAMDLRTHNRTDENTRTIFDDADYFAKNFFYKLLPITFEQVDETIIQSEHNYSLCSLDSESEAEEDCSRTMDYSQIKEKNYKRRRTKFRDGSDNEEEWDGNEQVVDSNQNIPNQKQFPEPESEPENTIQPLDLSSAPPVQEQKTDHHNCHLKEHSAALEEKLASKLNCIQVTITRPDEKENYQPCDMFLNDIARLVPRLINNDCLEIDILDKTGDRRDDLRTHRLYYIIAESTWKLFQNTSERVILTNDHTLGPPVKKTEKEERPKFLVFDQFSLAKCLAEYCQEIGGCFEYTCVEEEKEIEREESVKNTKVIELKTAAEDETSRKIYAEGIETVEPVEIETDNKRIEETNPESEETLSEKITSKPEDLNIYDENANSDTAKVVPKIKLDEAEVGNNSETNSENFNEDTKIEEEIIAERKTIDLQKNETNMETKEIRVEADVPVCLEPDGSKINEAETRQRKRSVRKKKRTRKNKIDAEDLNTNKIEEIKDTQVEEEKRKPDISEEKAIIPVDMMHAEPEKIDAKKTKEIEMIIPNDVKLSESAEKKIEMSVENEKTIESDFTATKTNKAEAKKIEMGTEETKKNEGNEKTIEADDAGKTGEEETKGKSAEKTIDEHFKKRTGDKKRTRTNKRRKKREKVKGIKEDIIENTPEKKTKQAKEANIDTEEIKSTKTDTKSRKEAEMNVKGTKIAKKIRKPIEQEKNSEKEMGVANKRRREEVGKTKNPPSKKMRRKVKAKNNLSAVPVPQIKTRSKSTSESETSQKPNKEMKKSKNTEKELLKKVKESAVRRTRTKNAIENRKGEVKEKENGMRVRGKKRKLEEERMVEERQLRSRGERVNVEKVSVFNKRRR